MHQVIYLFSSSHTHMHFFNSLTRHHDLKRLFFNTKYNTLMSFSRQTSTKTTTTNKVALGPLKPYPIFLLVTRPNNNNNNGFSQCVYSKNIHTKKEVKKSRSKSKFDQNHCFLLEFCCNAIFFSLVPIRSKT